MKILVLTVLHEEQDRSIPLNVVFLDSSIRPGRFLRLVVDTR